MLHPWANLLQQMPYPGTGNVVKRLKKCFGMSSGRGRMDGLGLTDSTTQKKKLYQILFLEGTVPAYG